MGQPELAEESHHNKLAYIQQKEGATKAKTEKQNWRRPKKA